MVSGKIKLIAMDVDGVLTDGKITIGSGGFEAKNFNVRDGLGLNILIKLGYQVLWITGRSSDIVERRAQELNIKHLKQGVVDKVRVVEEFLTELDLSWENVMYIGDDFNDLLLLQKAAIACTVSNASLEIKRVSEYVTRVIGGDGAVREIIEWFLKREKRWPEATELYLKTDRQPKSKGEVQ